MTTTLLIVVVAVCVVGLIALVVLAWRNHAAERRMSTYRSDSLRRRPRKGRH